MTESIFERLERILKEKESVSSKRRQFRELSPTDATRIMNKITQKPNNGNSKKPTNGDNKNKPVPGLDMMDIADQTNRIKRETSAFKQSELERIAKQNFKADVKRIQRKKLLDNLVWDTPFDQYKDILKTGNYLSFSNKDARAYFELLNNIRIDYDKFNSVQYCIKEHLVNGSSVETAKKFLNNTLISLIALYNFKAKSEPDNARQYTKKAEMIRKYVLDNAIKSFRNKNSCVDKEEVEKMLKEGGEANNVIQAAIDDLSVVFESRFEKMVNRHNRKIAEGHTQLVNPAQAYEKLIYGIKISKLAKPVEFMAGSKDYLSKILAETRKSA